MKLKVYVVRYKEDITPFLESYYSDPTVDHTSTSLTIINNYGELNSEINTVKLMFKYPDLANGKITVLNNVLRPDFSTGHLSRNWNQAIINGFKDLNNPDCDVVVCIQIDAKLTSSWYSTVKNIFESKKFDYFSLGRGDEFQYFTPLSVKTIGLFDERYCGIWHQEADYFIRALLHSVRDSVGDSERGNIDSDKIKVSINDIYHNRVYNPIENNIIEKTVTFTTSEAHTRSCPFGALYIKIFTYKWNCEPGNWNLTKIFSTGNLNVKQEFKYYPYFEKDINSDIYILE